MIVNLAYMAKLDDGEPNVEYRPVAVDDKKTRYLFEDQPWRRLEHVRHISGNRARPL